MMALVRSDELAKDVTGAEALLERHQVRTLDYQPLKPLCIRCAREVWIDRFIVEQVSRTVDAKPFQKYELGGCFSCSHFIWTPSHHQLK
jgi:uncharacterized protein with PIN domain